MSSASGGPPPEDEAANALSMNHPAEAATNTLEEQEKASEASNSQVGSSMVSTASGFGDAMASDANSSNESVTGVMDMVASTGQQKAEENILSGIESEIKNSASISLSQSIEGQEGGSKEGVSSNTNAEQRNHTGGEAIDGSEMAGVERAEQRQVYVTSTTSTSSPSSQSNEIVSKTSEDISQSPPSQVPSRRRVKVYALSVKTGVWDDRGTGCVDIRAWDPEVRFFIPIFLFSISLPIVFPTLKRTITNLIAVIGISISWRAFLSLCPYFHPPTSSLCSLLSDFLFPHSPTTHFCLTYYFRNRLMIPFH
jgi:hypothetical protein